MATYTYNFDLNFNISAVRLMIADTGNLLSIQSPSGTFFIFQDAEINAALQIESSQGLFISSQASPTALGNSIPTVPQIYSVRRAAALLLDSLASNKAYLESVIQLLDVKLASDKAAQELRAEAKQLRDTEAMSGNFAIAESVNDQFQARERVLKQWLRLYSS